MESFCIFKTETHELLVTSDIILYLWLYKDTIIAENSIKQIIFNIKTFIGILKRLLILRILTINEYASIGLVITAKSVVRYKKISEDPVFSEYYLLGTLLSTIIVIIAFLMIIP